jgi:hypothetical protein
VKPEVLATQYRHTGKHPESVIKGFRVLLDNMQDAKHRLAMYSSTMEFMNDMGRNRTYISDEQLHAMELCIYHYIRVQVEV